MSILLTSKVVRLALNAASYAAFTDQLTNSPVLFPKAALRIDAAAFFHAINTAQVLVDVTNWVSMTATFKALGSSNTAPAGTSPTLAEVTVAAASLNTSLTVEQWKAFTHQHASFAFTEAQINALPSGPCWLVFTALLGTGQVVPLQFGQVATVEDGYGIADPEDVVDGTAYTKAEALALFGGTFNDITARTGGGVHALDGLATDGVILTGTSVRTRSGPAGAREEWVLEAGGDAENAEAGLVRPDDYDGTTNERVWKRIL